MINDQPTDWKGNVIKEGDEIIIVSTQPLFGTMQMYIMDFSNGTSTPVGEPYTPPKHIWTPSAPMKIESRQGRLRYINQVGEHTFYMDLSLLHFELQGTDIICIKGKSDSEEEYYKEYFKA